MKQPKLLVLVILLVTTLSCNNQQKGGDTDGGGGSGSFLPNVSGKAGDIMVVTTKERWDGPIGDTCKKIFTQAIYGLPQPEPLFDLSFMPVKAFRDLVKTNRNIVLVKINPDYSSAELNIRRNVWAKPQVVLEVNAAGEAEAASALTKNEERIINLFNQAERNRLMDYYKKYEAINIRKLLLDKHNLGLYFPQGYEFKENKNRFIWITHETPKTSQGIFIYYYDYRHPNTFSRDFLVSKRNEILKNQVPGPKPGTYMTTEYRYKPRFEEINYKGRYFAHLKGLWRVENYFMGGPFISYTTLHEPTNRVVTVEGYVYGPRDDKRELLRQVKAICLSLYFPES